MAKKIIALLLIICCMTITVNAQILHTTYSPPNYFVGYFDAQGYETEEMEFVFDYYLNAYYNDNTNKVSSPIPTGYNYQPIVGAWTSYIEYDTIYKFSMYLDFEGLTTELKTGMVNGASLHIIPSSYFASVIPGNVGNLQVVTGPDMYTYMLMTTEPQYHIFYDATRKQLSAIFTVPSEWANEIDVTNFNNFLVVNLGNTYGSATWSSTVELVSYTGLSVKDNYTEILEEIRDKLESMAGGGGLTEEQINQAIQDALTAHDQMLEQEVDSKLDQILEQIGGVTEPYKQAVDQITGTLANVSNIFSYAGTDAVLTLPAAVNPLAGNAVLWQAQQIDLGAAYNTLPSSLRTLLQYALRAAVLLAVLHEVINIIKYAIIGRGDKVD